MRTTIALLIALAALIAADAAQSVPQTLPGAHVLRFMLGMATVISGGSVLGIAAA